jgi:lipoprotein-anchoring transpeptidase ErfK/SrfK
MQWRKRAGQFGPEQSRKTAMNEQEGIPDLGGGEAPPSPTPDAPRRLWLLTTAGVAFLFVFAGLLLLAAIFFVSTGYGRHSLSPSYIQTHTIRGPLVMTSEKGEPLPAPDPKALAKLVPKGGVYIVIDRVHNRLLLFENGQNILSAVISAGAGSILEDPTGKRKWVFDTPTGRFYVKSKRENPTWTAPDWEYIESGEPMPRNYSDRVQEGMLGEYALDLGGGPTGYMIHGTLYTRLLGRNVSHGCIRVGRDDLRVIWKKAPVGTPVFMF